MSEKAEDRDATRASLLIAVGDPNNHQAWEAFLGRYEPMVQGWCRQWFPDAADDMAQEVFLKLVIVMRTFQYRPDRGRFRGWLKTVTHRLMSDLKREPRQVHLSDEVFNVEAHLDLESRLAAEYDLELLEMARENVRGRVEERTWKAYEATAEQDQAPAEVARELGMKVGAIYQARYSVQLALRREIQALESTT